MISLEKCRNNDLRNGKNPEHFTIERSKSYLEIAEDKGIDIENIKLLLDNELDDYKDMLEADNAMYDIEKQ